MTVTTLVHDRGMQTMLDRLADKFEVSDDCWLWTASIDAYGYGQFAVDRIMRKAHRVIYELLVGPIPPGHDLDHLCRVRRCVRPSHLEPVTRATNVLRGEGIAALNAAKTHCPAGHAYDTENTSFRAGPNGRTYRACKACDRAGHKSKYQPRRRQN